MNCLPEDRVEAFMPSISDWFLSKLVYFETFSEVDKTFNATGIRFLALRHQSR